MSNFWLSKSTFIRSIKCQKALYLNKYHKELRDEMDSGQEAIFKQGTSVGELAQQLFPGGTDVTPESYFDFAPAIIKTAELLQQYDVVIYEAAFQFEGVVCALDILVKENGKIKAYEVKSSTGVKEVYLQDAGLQYYIMKQCGYESEDISIVHINNKYVRQGNLDVQQLFHIATIKEETIEFQAQIPGLLAQAKQTLEADNIPEQDIGPYCHSPYPCDFMGHCWAHVPAYSVFNIANLRSNKKFELYQNGFLKLSDVPDDFPLNDRQRLQIQSENDDSTFIEKDAIQEFLSQLNYPLHFLDFETFQSAIPLFDNSKPYQQMVFQYSLHINSLGGEMEHKEFLAEGNGTDPREYFIENLIKDCQSSGDILVYNIGFERGRLQELQRIFPELQSDIQALIDRMVDLMVPFQSKLFYASSLQGSYSIKKVLPALVPDLDYGSLEIQNGGMAMDTFASMMNGTFEGDSEHTRQALLDYCKMDTRAMVEIVRRLEEITQ